MTNPSNRKVIATCKNEDCNNTVMVVNSQAHNAYCEGCRLEAKHLAYRNYYYRHHSRIMKRRKAERDRKPKPLCWWPDCNELVAHGRARHCEFHLVPSLMMAENHWVELKMWINEQIKQTPKTGKP